jgi:hypothetical protein
MRAVRCGLLAQVEGTCTGRYGFVVLVTNIKDIGEARAQRFTQHRACLGGPGPVGAQRLSDARSPPALPPVRSLPHHQSSALTWQRACFPQGVIQDTSAFAKFAVSFECIVFRPFKGEVLDCVVTSVNKARRPRHSRRTPSRAAHALAAPRVARSTRAAQFAPAQC